MENFDFEGFLLDAGAIMCLIGIAAMGWFFITLFFHLTF